MSDDRSDVTDSGYVGMARNLVRMFGGDEKADELDRVVQDVTPPGTSADEFDQLFEGTLSQAEAVSRNIGDTGEGPALSTIQLEDGGVQVVVDVPPGEIDVFAGSESILLRTGQNEEEVPVGFPVEEVEDVSDPDSTMTKLEVRPFQEDESEATADPDDQEDITDDLEPADVDAEEILDELEEEADDVDTCRFCDEEVKSLEHAANHHAQTHPRKKFDPMWYLELVDEDDELIEEKIGQWLDEPEPPVLDAPAGEEDRVDIPLEADDEEENEDPIRTDYPPEEGEDAEGYPGVDLDADDEE